MQLKAKLERAGVDAASLAPLRLEAEPLYRLSVPGASALELWQRLRERVADTGHYPLVLGGEREALELLADQLTWGERPTRQLLERARSLAPDPAGWAEARVRDFTEYLRASGVGSEELARWQEETADEEPGEPAPPRPQALGPGRAFGLLGEAARRGPPERVVLALVPTTRPWEAPVYLRFGGYNECPQPEQHAALLRHWHERFGAEPVTVGHDVLECRVAAPPSRPEVALALAREQAAYCPDLLEAGPGSLEALAHALLGAPVWSFWWD